MGHELFDVIDFSIVEPYKLKVTLEKYRTKEHIKKVVDLKPFLYGELFEPLNNPDFFAKVTLNKEYANLVWPNDADFDPAFYYEEGQDCV